MAEVKNLKDEIVRESEAAGEPIERKDIEVNESRTAPVNPKTADASEPQKAASPNPFEGAAPTRRSQPMSRRGRLTIR